MGTVYRINTVIISQMTAASIEEPSSITREIWRTPTHIVLVSSVCVCVHARSRAPPLCVRSYLSVSGGAAGCLCTCVASHPDARGSAAIRGGKLEPWKDGPHLLTDLLFLPSSPSSSSSLFPSSKHFHTKENGSFVRGGQATNPHPTPPDPSHPSVGQHWHNCSPVRWLAGALAPDSVASRYRRPRVSKKNLRIASRGLR